MIETPNDGTWARFLDGEAVEENELTALLARAEADEGLRRELLEDARLDGWMRGILQARRGGEDWVRATAARLAAEQTRDEFVARVTAGIEGRSVAQRMATWVHRSRAWLGITGAACAAAAGWLLLAHVPKGTAPTQRPGTLTTTAPLTPAPSAAPVAVPRTVIAPAPAVTGPREIIHAFDFEDGVRAPGWHVAPTRRCPPHGASRFCLMARKAPDDSQWPDIVGVRIENRKDGIFDQVPGTVIAFDYWLGQSTEQAKPWVELWLSDDTSGASYHHRVDDVQAGRWMHLEIPVDDFRPPRRTVAPQTIPPGNRVGFMLIQTSWNVEDVLFVDDVRFDRPAQPAR